MSDLSLRIEKVDASHIPLYEDLSRSVYSETAVCRADHLRWKFLDNPQGPSWGVHLFAGDLLVGRFVAQPRIFEAPDRLMRAAYIVDLVMRPEFRGMSALLRLMNGMRNLHEFFDFVFVTPSASGMPVIESFLRIPARFDLTAKVVPLRPVKVASQFFRRRNRPLLSLVDVGFRSAALAGFAIAEAVGSLKIDESWPPAAELEAFLLTGSRGHVAGQRDSAFLDWRFRQSPDFKYQLFFLRRRGQLVGYVATRRAVYNGYFACFIIDAFGLESLKASDWKTVAWALIAREVSPGGADFLMILGNTACGPLAALARSPFISVPKRFLPQRTTLFADWWDGARPFDFAENSFQVTLADCDMF